MRPSMRKSLTALAVLLLIAAAAYYWLIMESHAPADAHYAFDIAEIRRLADASAGEKPSAIEVEQVAVFSFPATAVVAGDGWDSRDLPVYSYRLVYPDQHGDRRHGAQSGRRRWRPRVVRCGRIPADASRDVAGVIDCDHA